MEPITVIRIEHPSDRKGLWLSKADGAYKERIDSCSFYHAILQRHGSFPNPTWQGDVKGFIEGKHYCAFKSIDQIQEWMEKEWFKELFKIGFKVLMLDVTDYPIGQYQIAYTKESIITSKDISSLF